MIIGLSGYAGSGKDLVAQIIARRLMGQSAEMVKENLSVSLNNIPLIRKFSGMLKEVAGILTGYHPQSFESQEFKAAEIPGWGMTGREFLQKLGTEAIRDNLHKDAWVIAATADLEPGMIAIFTDCRFPNEVEAIKKLEGLVVRVTRPGYGPVNNHPSETALDEYGFFDLLIENNGSPEDLVDTIYSIDFSTKPHF